MDQHRASPRLPFDDVDLDDTPGLTAADRAALDAIRRQLAEEYPGAEAAPSLSIEPGSTSTAARARSGRQWRLPVVAALVTLAAVGGSVVGAMVTVHILRDPVTATQGTHEMAPAPLALPQADPTPAVPVGSTAHVTPEARVDRALGTVSRSRRPPEPVPVVPSSPRAEDIAASIPDVVASEAASPAAPPEAARRIPPAPTTRTPRRPTPAAGPEPQGWSAPFRPPSTETAAHAGVAKAAFDASTASRVPPLDPPPTAPSLPPPAAVAPPQVASPRPPPVAPGAAPDSPGARRGQGLLTSIRKDWDTVKSGFRSAPEEFKEAWGSFTRDLKGLLDR